MVCSYRISLNLSSCFGTNVPFFLGFCYFLICLITRAKNEFTILGRLWYQWSLREENRHDTESRRGGSYLRNILTSFSKAKTKGRSPGVRRPGFALMTWGIELINAFAVA